MDKEELNKCSIELRNPEAAKLERYKLCFNYKSSRRNSGAANIMELEGYCVYGLLMELNEEELEKIRDKEGCKDFRHKGCPNNYDEIKVKVLKCENGEKIEDVTTYKVTKAKEISVHVPPKESYMKLIITSAEKYGFPCEYIKFLKSIKTEKD